MSSAERLRERFRDHLAREGWIRDGDQVLVALSGGLDSMVLLHLLRFTPDLPDFRLSALHFDHRMRAESTEDAAWVATAAADWKVPLIQGTAPEVPLSETTAREARYAFFESQLSGEHERVWIVTGHHADDQAETVLFRVLRGTGVPGLQGIPPVREPCYLRPLLPFWRSELSDYAEECGVEFREDPTNLETDFTRNFLRRELIPWIEERISPAVKGSLVQLVRSARRDEEAWESVLRPIVDRVVLQKGTGVDEDRERGPLVLDREELIRYDPGVIARILRTVAEFDGVRLSEAGTLNAVEFVQSATSGAEVDLASGWALRREFDRIVRVGGTIAAEMMPVSISSSSAGEGSGLLAGRSVKVEWGAELATQFDLSVSFSRSGISFPLSLRSWVPGDRIRTSVGTKKLKKLFLEHRIPLSERATVPVLVDATGEVLWVPGLARSTEGVPEAGMPVLCVGISLDPRAPAEEGVFDGGSQNDR